MNIQSAGEGPVHVVLAPGGPGLVPEFYRELVDGIDGDATVTTVAFSGTAPQPAVPFPRTVQAAAAELSEALERVRDQRPTVLLGHSYGGAVVIELLASQPETPVDGAILISSFPSGRFIARGIRNRMDALPSDFHHALSDADGDPARIARLVGEYWFPRHFCRVPWPESFTRGLERVNGEFMNHVLGPSVFEPHGSISHWDREVDIPGIRSPLLVIGGRYDYFEPEAVRNAFEPRGPMSSRRRFAFSNTASHSIWIEDPGTAFSAISGFLREMLLHKT